MIADEIALMSIVYSECGTSGSRSVTGTAILFHWLKPVPPEITYQVTRQFQEELALPEIPATRHPRWRRG